MSPVDLMAVTSLLRLCILINQDTPYSDHFKQNRTNCLSSTNALDLHPLEASASILGLGEDVLATGYTVDAETVEIDLKTPSGAGNGRYALKIVVVPNPKGGRNAKGKGTSNPHRLRLLDVDNATDLWSEVKNDEWHCASLR